MNLTRSLAAICLTFAVAGSTAHAQSAAAAGLDGTWNVVAKVRMDTCGVGTPAVYQWLLTDDEGKIDVQVLGETTWRKLAGQLSGRDVVLKGTNGTATTLMHLKLTSPTRMEGERLSSVVVGYNSCGVMYTITATKQ